MRNAAVEALNGYLPALYAGIRVLFLLLLGYVVTLIVSRLIRAIRVYGTRVMIEGGALDFEAEKRAATVATFARRCLLTLLWGAIIITALQEVGFKINALLAGAGVSAGIIGVAVGFGAQSLIKDIIAGLFMLVENQIRVSDVAVVNGIAGTVEQINLRTTVIRTENGAVHVIPNGAITTLANLTRDFSYYVFELTVPHEQDTDQLTAVLRDVAAEIRTDPVLGPFVLDNLDVSGVDRLTQTGVVLKARIKTLPTKQWVVGREMNRRIRERCKTVQIDLGPEPTDVRLDRTQLKALIREVLEESGVSNSRSHAV